MFARFKDFDGKNVSVIPYKVAAVFETSLQRQNEDSTEVETINVMAISMDNGATFFVADSERAVRSRIEKTANNGVLIGSNEPSGEPSSTDAAEPTA